jgi:HSP20 family protein
MTNIAKFQPHPATKFALHGLMDNFFGRELSDIVGQDAHSGAPAVNVREDENGFALELAAPGFDKSQFALQVEKEHLILSATKAVKETSADTGRYVRREFRYDAFKRSFKLPLSVNQEAISAVYENGILVVSLPKKEEAKPVTKQIEIL